MSSSNALPGGHFISLATAKAMTARYRAEKDNILAPAYKGTDTLLICETFNRAEFDWVLAQTTCAGLRVYFGMEPDLKVKVIIVGVDADGKDILPAETSTLTVEGGETGIIEVGRPCPPNCPTPPL